MNHVGLAPKDPAKTRWFFREALGVSHLGDELVFSQKTETAMFSSGAASDARLEILAPALDAEGVRQGPIAQFLEKKGSGVHHVALTVDDVEKAIAHMLTLGVRMIDATPRPGAHETRIAFVHPESTGGLLIELVQEKTS